MELTSNKDNRNSERNHQYKISIYLSLPQGDNPNLEISIDYLQDNICIKKGNRR